MQINDYSQVAVLTNPRTLHGAVSWKSVAEARHLSSDANFSDAIDLSARSRVFDYDTRLLDVVDTLRQDDFIFVRDFDHKITGIITTAMWSTSTTPKDSDVDKLRHFLNLIRRYSK